MRLNRFEYWRGTCSGTQFLCFPDKISETFGTSLVSPLTRISPSSRRVSIGPPPTSPLVSPTSSFNPQPTGPYNGTSNRPTPQRWHDASLAHLRNKPNSHP